MMKSDHKIDSMYTLPCPTLQSKPKLSTPLKRVCTGYEDSEDSNQWHSTYETQVIPGSISRLQVPESTPRPKRTRFEDKRREQVAEVRHKGACLKCRLDKITCSNSRPCDSCNRSHVPGYARVSKRHWMHCVPFSFKHVDIYTMCELQIFPSLLTGQC